LFIFYHTSCYSYISIQKRDINSSGPSNHEAIFGASAPVDWGLAFGIVLVVAALSIAAGIALAAAFALALAAAFALASTAALVLNGLPCGSLHPSLLVCVVNGSPTFISPCSLCFFNTNNNLMQSFLQNAQKCEKNAKKNGKKH